MKILLLLVFLFVALLFDLGSGSTHISYLEIIKTIFYGATPIINPNVHEVLWDLRLPRILTALFAGSALSVAGLQMQMLFRNPLAGPSELGLSSGAGLGVACFVLLGWKGPSFLNQAGLLGAAALGAAAVMVLLLLLSPLLRNSTAMLLAGLLISSALGAGIAALQAFGDAESLQNFVLWTMGSLSGVTWNQLFTLAPICLLGLIFSVLGAKSLTALMLGEDEARSLGSRVAFSRFLVAANASLLAATITAFCGPIAFLGLAIPHVARWFMNQSNPRILSPVSAILGAIALLFCDAVSQTLFSGRILPINVVTSAIGAPIVLILLLRFQKRSQA